MLPARMPIQPNRDIKHTCKLIYTFFVALLNLKMVELFHFISAKDSEALEAINTMCPHLRVIKLNGGTLLDSIRRDEFPLRSYNLF